MVNYRYVYYVSEACLHNIVEYSLKDCKFDVLNIYEKNELYFNLMNSCSNRYYNENRIRYFVKKSMKHISSKYVIDEFIDIIVKHMINTKIAVDYVSKEKYYILLSEERVNKDINIKQSNKCDCRILCN